MSKGQIGKLGEIILIITGAIVLMLFIGSRIDRSVYEKSIEGCRFSVLAQFATELNPKPSGMKSPFGIDCDKRYVKFYNSKVELGLNPDDMKAMTLNIEGQKLTRFKELSESYVDNVIAEEMRICKYQFADAKVEIWTNEESFFASKNVCFICSEIEFDKGVRRKEFTGLVEYTNKTLIKDTQITYFDYLTAKSFTGNTIWLQPMFNEDTKTGKIMDDYNKAYGDLDIDVSKKYVVFFEKFKPSKNTIFIPIIGPTLTVLNPRDPYFWIAVAPYEDINNYCEVQAS